MTTKIIEDAVTALLKLNNNRDRILALYEAMRREELPQSPDAQWADDYWKRKYRGGGY